MKKWVLIFSVVVLGVACTGSNKKTTGGNNANDSAQHLTAEEKQKAIADSSNFTSLEWLDSTTKDLGKLVKDQSVEISFRFKNTGSRNLVIESVTAGCGCTIPEKPEQPVAPGEEGLIKAKYNGSGHGTISKEIYVKANTSPSVDHILTFTGQIQEK
ncbi:MAG: DUF1573 domain-containing protein [Bacteroidota bacterium]